VTECTWEKGMSQGAGGSINGTASKCIVSSFLLNKSTNNVRIVG